MHEIVLSQFICNLSATVVQATTAMFLSFYVFELECRGSLSHVALLIVIQSITGITFGKNTDTNAAYIAHTASGSVHVAKQH